MLAGRGQVAHGPADPDETLAGPRQPVELIQGLAQMVTQALELLLARRTAPGQELLGQPDGAQRQRAELGGAPAGHLDELEASATQLQHRSVDER